MISDPVRNIDIIEIVKGSSRCFVNCNLCGKKEVFLVREVAQESAREVKVAGGVDKCGVGCTGWEEPVRKVLVGASVIARSFSHQLCGLRRKGVDETGELDGDGTHRFSGLQ